MSDSEFVLRERAVVTIRENYPIMGVVSIYYTPAKGYVARGMEIPERAFIEEFKRYADRKKAKAERAAERQKAREQGATAYTSVEQSDPPPRPSAAPLPPRRLIRPPATAQA